MPPISAQPNRCTLDRQPATRHYFRRSSPSELVGGPTIIWPPSSAVGRIQQRSAPAAALDRSTGWLSRLTSREQEVVRAALDGVPNGTIAARLAISEITVKKHMSRIFESWRCATVPTSSSSSGPAMRREFH